MEINIDINHQLEEKKECVICLDEVETEWRELECHHRYHTRCIEKWIIIRAKCPMCMKIIKDNKIENRNENRNWNVLDNIHNISIKRFVTLLLIIFCVIILAIVCRS